MVDWDEYNVQVPNLEELLLPICDYEAMDSGFMDGTWRVCGCVLSAAIRLGSHDILFYFCVRAVAAIQTLAFMHWTEVVGVVMCHRNRNAILKAQPCND